MRTWNDYKSYVKNVDEKEKNNMEIIEKVSEIVSDYIKKREEMGLSQRDLSNIIGIKQSSLARMESLRVNPQLYTMLKVLKPLGLTLEVVPAK